MLDIIIGDTLVAGGVEYTVRFVKPYVDQDDPAFALETTVSASTKRPVISSGQRSAAVTNLASVKCTQVDPAGNDMLERITTEIPYSLMECFVADASSYSYLALEKVTR